MDIKSPQRWLASYSRAPPGYKEQSEWRQPWCPCSWSCSPWPPSPWPPPSRRGRSSAALPTNFSAASQRLRVSQHILDIIILMKICIPCIPPKGVWLFSCKALKQLSQTKIYNVRKVAKYNNNKKSRGIRRLWPFEQFGWNHGLHQWYPCCN